MPGAETCRVGPWPGVEWGPGVVRTQVAVSPPWGWRPGCEGQRRGWAGLSHAFPLEGSREEDDDDYENMTPSRAEKEQEKLRLGEEGLWVCGQSRGSGAAFPPTLPRGLAHRPALTSYTKPNVLVMSSLTWVYLHHRNGEAAWLRIPPSQLLTLISCHLRGDYNRECHRSPPALWMVWNVGKGVGWMRSWPGQRPLEGR